FLFFFSSRRRHTRFSRDWSSDVCSSDLIQAEPYIDVHFFESRRFSQGGDVRRRRRAPGLGNTQCHDLARLYMRQAGRHHENAVIDRKSTRLNSSHVKISYAVFCLKKKKK